MRKHNLLPTYQIGDLLKLKDREEKEFHALILDIKSVNLSEQFPEIYLYLVHDYEEDDTYDLLVTELDSMVVEKI